MQNTTKTKGVPATDRPKTPRNQYTAICIFLVKHSIIIDVLLLVIMMFEGLMIGRGL